MTTILIQCFLGTIGILGVFYIIVRGIRWAYYKEGSFFGLPSLPTQMDSMHGRLGVVLMSQFIMVGMTIAGVYAPLLFVA